MSEPRQHMLRTTARHLQPECWTGSRWGGGVTAIRRPNLGISLQALRAPRQLGRRSTSGRTPCARRLPPPAQPSRAAAGCHILQERGMPEQRAKVQTLVREGQPIDITVAAGPIAEGELALRIPERLVVTLERIFDDAAVAEVGPGPGTQRGRGTLHRQAAVLSQLSLLRLGICGPFPTPPASLYSGCPPARSCSPPTSSASWRCWRSICKSWRCSALALLSC